MKQFLGNTGDVSQQVHKNTRRHVKKRLFSSIGSNVNGMATVSTSVNICLWCSKEEW